MKKLIAIMLTVGLFAAVSVPAFAGGRGGYSGRGGYYGHGGFGVGGFFAGLVGGHSGTVLSAPYAPYYAPAPRVYYAPPPEQVWVPGHYETRYERQWVPGHWEVERYSGHGEGEDDGYSRGGRVWIPGRYEEGRVRVWLPGHWEG